MTYMCFLDELLMNFLSKLPYVCGYADAFSCLTVLQKKIVLKLLNVKLYSLIKWKIIKWKIIFSI
jgi:hypothetical protein